MPECVKVDPGATKRCTKCGVVKWVEEYGVDSRLPAPGRVSQCKECKRLYARMLRAQDIERSREVNRRWRERNRLSYNAKRRQEHREDPRPTLLQHAKYRARKLGIPFAITACDLVVEDKCPVLGIAYQVGPKISDRSRTVDRIIPGLGYVPGNVRVISYRANRLKSDASPQELSAILDYIASSQNKTPHGPAGSGSGADGRNRTGVIDATSIAPSHSATSATGTDG